MGVFEVLPINGGVSKLIEAKASESAIGVYARDTGMRPLAEQAAAMVAAGSTTADEVLRVVDVAEVAARCPPCSGAVEDTFVLCPHCATPLHYTCGNCARPLKKGWQICPHCGTATKPAPMATPAPAPAAPPPIQRVVSEPAGERQYRALVVDDQPDFRRLIAFTLEHSDLGVSVTTAANGIEALARAEVDPPDLIVLDVMMPEMDGFEVCERLRANVRTAFVPILMLTALDDPGNRTRGFHAGTDDYIGKPFARADLLARVRRLLQRTYGATFKEPTPTRSNFSHVESAERMSA